MFVERYWVLGVVASGLLHGAALLVPLSVPKTGGVEAIRVVVLHEAREGMAGGQRPGPLSGPSDRRWKSGGPPRRGNVNPSRERTAKVAEEPAPGPLHTAARREAPAVEQLRQTAGPPAGGAGAGIAEAGGGGEAHNVGGGKGGRGPGRGGEGTGAGHGSGTGEIGFGGPSGPRFLRREMPEYPPQARRYRIEGKVVLMVSIDEQGRLANVEVAEASDPVFVRPSVEAVKKSTFLPAVRNGVPIAVKAVLPIRFSLKNS